MRRQLAMQDLEAWLAKGVRANHAGLHDEAELAFQAALAIDPDHGEAHFGLGLSRMSARRFIDAVVPLRRAASGPRADQIHKICLGQALYMTGAFAQSAQALDEAAGYSPLPINAWRIWARSRTFAAILDGEAELALRQYPALAGKDAEDLDTLAAEALSIFTAFDHLDAARAVAHWLTARHPNEPRLAYRRRVLDGDVMTKAPADYVQAYFDAFAGHFDQKLEGALGYQAPEQLCALLASFAPSFDDILDLGCGTGLAARALGRFGGRLTGVDLSGGMLALAAERNAYQTLVQADAVDFLGERPGGFDLILVADMLIYLGDLAPFFIAAASALRPGGYLAISTEIALEGWKVLSSGRFAHARAYISELADPGFEVLDRRHVDLRREGHANISGDLWILRRRIAQASSGPDGAASVRPG